nr:competence protein ComEC family protein [Clostridiales bacterium]
MKRAMAVIGFSFLITLIAVGVLGEKSAWIVALLSAILFVVSLFSEKLRKNRAVLVVALCVFSASIIFGSTFNYVYKPVVSLDGTQAYLDCKIIDNPKYEYGKYYYNAKITALNNEAFDAKIRLSFKEPIDADYYDTISGEFKIYALGKTSEKSLTSYKAKGIFIGGYNINGYETTENNHKPFMYYILKFRDYISDNIRSVLTGDEGALLFGMLIGNKQFISNNIIEDFRTDGISHLLAVSGLHLSIWSGFIIELFNHIKIKRRLSAIV